MTYSGPPARPPIPPSPGPCIVGLDKRKVYFNQNTISKYTADLYEINGTCQEFRHIEFFLSKEFGKAVATFEGSPPTDLLRTQLYRTG